MVNGPITIVAKSILVVFGQTITNIFWILIECILEVGILIEYIFFFRMKFCIHKYIYFLNFCFQKRIINFVRGNQNIKKIQFFFSYYSQFLTNHTKLIVGNNFLQFHFAVKTIIIIQNIIHTTKLLRKVFPFMTVLILWARQLAHFLL